MVTNTDSQTGSETDGRSDRRTAIEQVLAAGAGVGGAGGVVMGLALSALVPTFLTEMAPALYDLQGGVAGWFAHLVHSAVFGVVFAVLFAMSPLRRYADGVGDTTVAGLGWGLFLWVVATGIVLPVWLSLTTFPEAPLIPYLRPAVLAGHLAYGATVGVLLGAARSLLG